jgi:formylglycine-generating enzyme required for sulfatase activity
VGCFPSGASLSEVEELCGNVWEWTRSLDGKYPYPSGKRARVRREDLQASRDKRRVLRGGAFFGFRRHVRCAFRFWSGPGDRGRNMGFRVVVLPSL